MAYVKRGQRRDYYPAEMCGMDAQQAHQREYLLKATECERSASETLDPIAAKTYRDMARQWRELSTRSSPSIFFEIGRGPLGSEARALRPRS
jgi:hypothetical protein